MILTLSSSPMFALADSYVSFSTLTYNSNSMPYYGGEYVGPINAVLENSSSSSNGTLIQGGLTCVDFLTTTYVPGTYEFDVVSLTLGNMGLVKFRVTNSGVLDAEATLKLYEEAAWLNMEITENTSSTGAIQFAMWDLFDQSASSNLSQSEKNDVESWLAQASNNYMGYDYSQAEIYIPDPNQTNPPQEFITGDPSPVPEPVTMVLFGTGLVGLAGLVRRKQA